MDTIKKSMDEEIIKIVDAKLAVAANKKSRQFLLKNTKAIAAYVNKNFFNLNFKLLNYDCIFSNSFTEKIKTVIELREEAENRKKVEAANRIKYIDEIKKNFDIIYKKVDVANNKIINDEIKKNVGELRKEVENFKLKFSKTDDDDTELSLTVLNNKI